MKTKQKTTFNSAIHDAFYKAVSAQLFLRSADTELLAKTAESLLKHGGRYSFYLYDKAMARMGTTHGQFRVDVDNRFSDYARKNRVRLSPMPFRGDDERKIKKIDAEFSL